VRRVRPPLNPPLHTTFKIQFLTLKMHKNVAGLNRHITSSLVCKIFSVFNTSIEITFVIIIFAAKYFFNDN
jgi:hypothetical protein